MCDLVSFAIILVSVAASTIGFMGKSELLVALRRRRYDDDDFRGDASFAGGLNLDALAI